MTASFIILAYIDVRPFVLAGGLFVIGAVVLGYRAAAGRWPRARLSIGAVIAILVLFAFFFYGPFVGYTRNVTHRMKWRIDSLPHSETGASHVVLTFRDYPAYHVGIYSNDLADYLRSLPDENVPVYFEVTYDYGSVRGFRETRIGDQKAWKSDFSYFGSTGSPRRSPF
jgi:hypothetical protein